MRIIFTGGGTAGHVNPNLALIDVFEKKDFKIFYLGGKNSVESRMITARNIPFFPIRSGKLRRYFSWQNLIDPFNLLCGIVQAYWRIKQLKPDVVFSKGGFVAFPVVVGAWLNRIPVIAHESDLTPGLANRLSLPFVSTLCVTFEATKKHLNQSKKVIVTGTPIRPALLEGDLKRGLTLCGFSAEKPCLLVMGGSQGAQVINRCVRQSLEQLTAQFQIIHLCGKGQLDEKISSPDYFQMEYAESELPDLIAASAGIISRAGANALYEILVCAKPHVLIPLSSQSSRGDQIHNAKYFEKQGISIVIPEEKLTSDTLLKAVDEMYARREETVEKIKALNIQSGTAAIVELILQLKPKTLEKH